jgi:hypothetical protein
MAAAAASTDKSSKSGSGRKLILEKFPKSSFISGSAIGEGGFGSVVSGLLFVFVI